MANEKTSTLPSDEGPFAGPSRAFISGRDVGRMIKTISSGLDFLDTGYEMATEDPDDLRNLIATVCNSLRPVAGELEELLGEHPEILNPGWIHYEAFGKVARDFQKKVLEDAGGLEDENLTDTSRQKSPKSKRHQNVSTLLLVPRTPAQEIELSETPTS